MCARYTVELRDIIRSENGQDLIDKALSTYPLYEAPKQYDLVPTREELNKKIINHYRYREIGFETVGRFIEELEYTMCEIMPRYNELFKTVVIMADLPNPFDNVDFVETFEEERRGKSTSQGTSTNKESTEGSNNQETSSKTKGSSITSDDTIDKSTSENLEKNVMTTTPQNEISIPAKDIDNVSYADEVTWNEKTGTNEDTHKGTTDTKTDGTVEENIKGSTSGSVEGESTRQGQEDTEAMTKHTFTKKGNQGVNTYAHDMNEFRTSIIDVVDQIIHDERLNELFMMVY